MFKSMAVLTKVQPKIAEKEKDKNQFWADYQSNNLDFLDSFLLKTSKTTAQEY